jgi:hypothetical protein
MIEICGIKNCICILGSSNAKVTIRNIFSSDERRIFFQTIYPNIPLIDLPDYNSGERWFSFLDKIIFNSHLPKNKSIVYFGGCEQDVDFFTKDGRETYLLNRFNGTTPIVSATEIRDCLIHGRSIDKFVNPKIIDLVIKTFQNKKYVI